MASCTTAGVCGLERKYKGLLEGGGWGWNAASIKSECLTKILSIPLTFIRSNLLLKYKEYFQFFFHHYTLGICLIVGTENLQASMIQEAKSGQPVYSLSDF